MGKIFLPFTISYSIKIKGNMAYRSYVIVATICLFLLTSDIETMILNQMLEEHRGKHIAKKVDATYYLNYNMTKM